MSLWAMDEHRLGLKPILRTAWAPTGQPFSCPVHPRYEWLYVYAFVNPETGESRFWIMPTLNQQAYGLVMAAFAQSIGAGQDHHVLLVENNGGFHVPASQGHPLGIEMVRLPPYAPELQPVERVWHLTDATVANTCLENFEALEKAVNEQCAWLETQPDLITQHTLFHWWPLCQN